MTDWMDDLLSALPSESQPVGLDLRVRARLSGERRKERWARRALGATLLGAAALGLWLVGPALAELGMLVPHTSGESLGEWATLFLASPLPALNGALQGVLSWMSRVEERLEPGMILALVLIVVPALNAVAGLIRDVDRVEEGLA